MILPWFGGSAAVWATCMLFFQAGLLFGYLYADGAVRRLRPRAQSAIHVSLLAACLLVLPIVPGSGWKPTGAEDPALRILLLLLATVGLPYFALSATSPLLQAWYARTETESAPYRLFALSNAGSMLGLLSYPVLVEPNLPVHTQAVAWSVAFLCFCLLCGAAAVRGAGTGKGAPGPQDDGSAFEEFNKPDAAALLLWMALAACASTLLLAVTNHLTQNVAAIPFLWVLPLSLYLLSFILCFSKENRYSRIVFFPLLPAALGGMCYLLSQGFETARLALLIPVYAGGLFVCCMVCHGEVAAQKPHPRHLTGYYLMISLGGAIGGVFVGLVAPYCFNDYYELPAGIAACALFAWIILYRLPSSPAAWTRWRSGALLVSAAGAMALFVALGWQIRENTGNVRLNVRNFYGGLQVSDSNPADGKEAVRILVHGTITHGEQFLSPSLRRRPTAYYGTSSGVGLALRNIGRNPKKAGIVGLGAGTIAAYGGRGDRFRFYEINPLVVRLADTEFSFLRDTMAEVDVVLGDARLSMEAEPRQEFDILAVDAFSGDSIPVHLLTLEAFDVYFRHLKADGILAIHVSNKYLDLKPVVRLAADATGKAGVVVETDDDPDNACYGSTWVLISGNRAFFELPAVRKASKPLEGREDVRLWTDDYSNIFRILK